MELDEAHRRVLNTKLLEFLVQNPGGVQLLQLPASVLQEMPIFAKVFLQARWLADQALAWPDATVLLVVIDVIDPAGTAPHLHDLVTRLRTGALIWSTAAKDPLIVLDG